MKKLNLSLAIASGFLAMAICAPSAQASVLVEPYLGYHTGTADDGSGSSTATATVKGVTYGGRLGLQELGFMGGVDVMSGSWTVAYTPSLDAVPTDLGVFVGYNFPVMLRVYGVYGFSSQLKLSSNGQSNTMKGTDVKFGVGYTGLPMVSINLEYISESFTKYTAGAGGTFTNTHTGKLFGLTVSLPLTFL